MNNSSDNFYTSDVIDRLTEKRDNQKWLKEQLQKSNSLFIPIYQNKNLLNIDNDPQAVFFNKERIENIDDLKDRITLIGQLKDKVFFSISYSNGNIKESDLSKNEEFTDFKKYSALMSRDESSLLAYANALNNWQQRHNFCGRCGSKTQFSLAGHKLDCSNPECGQVHFPRTDPAIITLIYKDDKCLIARQSAWPKNRYSVIAGFVEPGESLENAVAREVFEETGIKIHKIAYLSSQPWPFPYLIMLGFKAEALTEEITLHDGELEEARWVSRDEIEEEFKNGTFKLPTHVSISYRLIESWFNENNDKKLQEIIK